MKVSKRRFWFLFGIAVLVLLLYMNALTQRDNVWEAVVRHEYAPRPGRLAPARQVVFVSINGKDPCDDFVRRFQQGNLLVRKASQGIKKTPLDAYTTYWLDPATGLKGGYINLMNVNWFGPAVAYVGFNYPMNGYRDTVVRRKFGWVVTERTMTWLH